MESNRPRIRQLPPGVVNQIAAGEVVERPASVVKELLENAVDAGATRIDVAVQRGGLDLIRVTDNGCGIAADELPLALASHATSKLRNAEDLFRVATLGFRGEALASIGAVSHLTLRSRPPEEAAGAQIVVRGTTPAEVRPCGCPPGTTVEVSQLFFNTPVRRKFLRTPQTELGHVAEAFTRVALAQPAIHFTLSHNGKVMYDLPPAEPWRERIAQFFGRELAEDLLEVASQENGVRLWGYVALPHHSRPNPKGQYLILNGRYVRDRSLQHALGEAYRGLLMTGRYPIAFLQFEMPPEEVDVNVHPTKLEVRFASGDRHYAQLLGTLRTRFLTTDLTARLDPQGGQLPGRAAAPGEEVLDRQRRELVEWVRQQLPAAASAASTTTQPPAPADPSLPVAIDFQTGQPVGLPPSAQPSAAGEPPPAWPAGLASPQGAGRFTPPPREGALPRAIQIHNCYLVAESDEGVVIIDQHALHERALYETLREKVLTSAVESQRLLVPEPVDLPPGEAAVVLDHAPLLAQLGLHVEPFGGDTVLLTGYPAILGKAAPAAVLRDVAGVLVGSGRMPDRRALLDSLLHGMACKAAVKAGDPLSPEEIQTLLAQRHLLADMHHCPHGRPTALVFTRDELDRQFKRT